MSNVIGQKHFISAFIEFFLELNFVVTILAGIKGISSLEQELAAYLQCLLLDALFQQICGWCDDTDPSVAGVQLLNNKKRWLNKSLSNLAGLQIESSK